MSREAAAGLLVGAQSIEPGGTSNGGRRAAAPALLPGGGEILMRAITTKLGRGGFISNCFTAVAAFMRRARPCAPALANSIAA